MIYRHVKRCPNCRRAYLCQNTATHECPACPGHSLTLGFDPDDTLTGSVNLVICVECSTLYFYHSNDNSACPKCKTILHQQINEAVFL